LNQKNPVMLKNFNLTIFLVDDDVLCLNLYQQFLKQLGYNNVEMYDNGNDCLDSLEEHHPDVIFLDYNMEGMNGIDVLKKIKEFNPNITVLFISGQENIEIAVNAMKHGALDYIIKASLNPERMKEIMEKVESMVPMAEPKQKKSFFKKLFS
jgi:DNA-binding NtrC family response regulator